MPTNPTPAVNRAVDAIIHAVRDYWTFDEDGTTRDSQFDKEVARIIDSAFADERAAGEAMAEILEGANLTRGDALLAEQWIAAWRKARGE